MTFPKWVQWIKTCPKSVTKRADSNLPRVCKRITVTLLKLKVCFLCIKNDLIEIAPFAWCYFDHFFLAFISKPMTWEAKLFKQSGKCLRQFKFRTATARYVGVNKLTREILIKIAPFPILRMIKLFHIKIRKTFCHNSSVKVKNPLPPPKRHIDVKRGNLSMDVTPNLT